MQINRLFEIVYMLLDKEKITAKQLSEHFEVSARTIYRDVETLSSCGIPIYMIKGKSGGISLTSNYVLNKMVLTTEEKTNILSALYSLNKLDKTSMENTLSKLGLFFGENNKSFFEIDFNDWGNLIKDQFEKSKQAILSHHLLCFDYISSQNSLSNRTVEPNVLWFKDRTWYLKAFCLEKNNFRVFRFSRMRNVKISNESFIPRRIDLDFMQYNDINIFPTTKITIQLEKSMEYRVMDEFAKSDVIENSDGTFTVSLNLIEDEWVYGYILSFGGAATVIEPNRIRNTIKERLEKALKNYL